jgi:excisionase family DNA binding protein
MQAIGEVDANCVLYSVKEAASVLAISQRSLYLYLERKLIPSVKIGSRRLIRRADLERLVDRLVSTDLCAEEA